MLTDQQIEDAKLKVTYSLEEGGHHEHPDCVRIAYEWLDAQVKTKGPNKSQRSIKHYVESWGGRYVSRTDVDLAAFLHPDVKGTYPFFNISSKLTLPSEVRLVGIGEAHIHNKVPNRADYERFE